MPVKKILVDLLTVLGVAIMACGLAYLPGSSERQFLGLPVLISLALIALAVQWLMFLPAYYFQTEHYYDLTGSFTYLLLIVLALVADAAAAPSERALLLGLLVLVWAMRLGGFLFARVKKLGKDGRFDQLKRRWSSFLVAWTLQGLWVFVTLLATLIAMTSPRSVDLGIWTVFGTLIWALGFVIEVLADVQKTRFKADAANASRFINTGLWAWSRHPNYFGEIVLWTGICVIAAPTFVGWQWLGLISPIFVAVLIMGVSGVPLLEQRAEEKWGKQADYQRYRETTPVLIPRPPS